MGSNISASRAKLLSENEKSTNNIVALAMLLFSMLSITIIVILILNYFDFGDGSSLYFLFYVSIFNIFPALFQIVFPNKIKHAKYVLLFIFTVSVGILDFLFSFQVILFVVAPTLLSARYYTKKTTIVVIIATILILFASSMVNYVACKYEWYSEKAFIDSFVDWHDLKSVTVRSFLLKSMIFLVPAAISYSIVANGKKMIIDQATSNEDIDIFEGDLEAASTIQNQVLPKDFQIARDFGYEISALMRPAKEVAGDFYDFFIINDNLYFLIGDVSDKGLYSAMYMMNVKNIIQSIALSKSDPAEILTLANNLICKDNDNLIFVTLWLACINKKTGKGYFSNAGHNFALYKDKNNEIKELENIPEPSVGIFSDYKYSKHEINIKDYENFLIYTDGVTDLINNKNENFGKDRLIEAYKKSNISPNKVISHIDFAMNNFKEKKEQFDDITLFVISYRKFDYEETFDCKAENIDLCIDATNELMIKNGICEEDINLIDTVIDDSLDNVISYAYDNQIGSFKYQLSLINDELTIVISDEGKLFNPKKAKSPDFSNQRKLGGLGIHLIKNIMDEMNYSRSNNKNILELKKKLNKEIKDA